MNSFKNQSHTLVRDEPPALGNVKHYALLDDVNRRPRKRSRPAMTVALVVMGLLAGWIAGMLLTGSFQRAKPVTDVPNEENTVQPSQPQPDPRPQANGMSEGKSVRSRDQRDESQPEVDMEHPPATSIEEDKDKESGDPWLGVPTGEQSTKEIGRSAMDKILKENDRMKRGKHLRANKNEE